MPWHIETDNPGCAGFAVVKDADGEIEGCHRTRDQAERQLAALYIAEPDEAAGVDTEEESSPPMDREAAVDFPRRRQIEEILAQLRAKRYS